MRTLEQIAMERDEAWQAYQGLGMVNTIGRDVAERVKLDVAYAKAKLRYYRLNDEYAAGIDRAAGGELAESGTDENATSY
jgi:hypothetical protein